MRDSACKPADRFQSLPLPELIGRRLRLLLCPPLLAEGPMELLGPSLQVTHEPERLVATPSVPLYEDGDGKQADKADRKDDPRPCPRESAHEPVPLTKGDEEPLVSDRYPVGDHAVALRNPVRTREQ